MEFPTNPPNGFDQDFSECFSVEAQNVPSTASQSVPSENVQQPERLVRTQNVPSATPEPNPHNIQQPYTPVSSRATPVFYSMPIERSQADCTNPAFFGLTPPESTFGGYFPDFKQEPMSFNQYPESPSRRDSNAVPSVGFQFQQPLPLPVETADPRHLARYPFADQPIPGSLELPPIPYYFENSPAYDLTPLAWPMDGPTYPFARPNPFNDAPFQNNQIPPIQTIQTIQPIPPIQPVQPVQPIQPVQHIQHIQPPSVQQARRLRVNDVQQKSVALQKVQQHRITKRKAAAPLHPYGGEVSVAGAGLHKCTHPNCVGKRGFKRQEHLKRHENTVHYLIKGCDCPFCNSHNFNRDDNFRNHVKLHTIKGGTGRTHYHPDAQDYLDMLNRSVKPRKVTKKTIDRRKKAAPRIIRTKLEPESQENTRQKAASQAITDQILSQIQPNSQGTMRRKAASQAITDQNLVQNESQGNIRKMAASQAMADQMLVQTEPRENMRNMAASQTISPRVLSELKAEPQNMMPPHIMA